MADSDEIRETMDKLREFIKTNSDYAWAWHCNLAMMAFDAGATHEKSNQQAANFMNSVFEFNVRDLPEYKHLELQWTNQKFFDKMVEEVTHWVKESPNEAEFRTCDEDDLIDYHHTLGQTIRNTFHLWDREWTPQICGGVDISLNHPDAISMAVITEVWEKLRTE